MDPDGGKPTPGEKLPQPRRGLWRLLRREKARGETYRLFDAEVREETRKLQMIFWAVIGAVTLVYGLTFSVQHADQVEAFGAYEISCLLLVCYAALCVWLCAGHFRRHQRRMLLFAYCNVEIITLVVEWQYLFCGNCMSYTLCLCVLMMTALMVIGPTRRYTLLITAVLGADVCYTGLVRYPGQPSELLSYGMDIVVTILTMAAINRYVYLTKCKEIANRAHLRKERDTDGMSQLLTRHAAEAQIRGRAQGEGLCALLILDIDNFKAINDTYGHMVGDEVIRQVAAVLRRVFRAEDCLARLGGDEFMVFLEGVAEKTVRGRAEQLLHLVSALDERLGKTIGVTCSVGVAFADASENPPDLFEDLYRQADAKLYQAKKSGKSQYCC